jgi:hypothetical protein
MDSVVSAALVFAFMITISAVIINFGLPLIDQYKQELNFQNGKNIVNSLSIDISDLLDKPINSSMVREIHFSEGVLKFQNNIISYSSSLDEYNRTFQNIQFTNTTLFTGTYNLKLTKESRNFIEIKILQ